jgi:hypothetical protein
MRSRFVAAALTFLLITNATANGGEAYYLLMFGSQRTPPDPDYSHTFATFVRATWVGNDPCPTNPTIESHTISWLPCNGIVRVLALCPEPGRSFGLDETIQWAMRNDMRTSIWGAYQIQPELYNRAVAQVALLQSGQVRYKAIDTGRETDKVSNCIHAVSSLSQGNRLRVATPGWGETASYYVLKELEPWICDKCPAAWVGSALGLDQYPLIYRDYENPRSNAVLGPLYRLSGSERNLRATYGPALR